MARFSEDDWAYLERTKARNQKLITTYVDSFLVVFQVPLNTYINDVFGFDILKFNRDVIQAGEKEVVRNALQRKFGQRGVDLVDKLLK